MPIIVKDSSSSDVKVVTSIKIGTKDATRALLVTPDSETGGVKQTLLWPAEGVTMLDLRNITSWKRNMDNEHYTITYTLDIPTPDLDGPDIQDLIDNKILQITYTDNICSLYESGSGKATFTCTISDNYANEYLIERYPTATNPYSWSYSPATHVHMLPQVSGDYVVTIGNYSKYAFSRLNPFYTVSGGSTVEATYLANYDKFEDLSTLTLVPYRYVSGLRNVDRSYKFAYWSESLKGGNIGTVTKDTIKYKDDGTLDYKILTTLSLDAQSTVKGKKVTAESSGAYVDRVYLNPDSYLSGGESDHSALTAAVRNKTQPLHIFYNQTISNKLKYVKPWTLKASLSMGYPDVPNNIAGLPYLYCWDPDGSKTNSGNPNFKQPWLITPQDFREVGTSSIPIFQTVSNGTNTNYRSKSAITQAGIDVAYAALYNFRNINYIITPRDTPVYLKNQAIGTNSPNTVVIVQGPATVSYQEGFQGKIFLLHKDAHCLSFSPGMHSGILVYPPGEIYALPDHPAVTGETENGASKTDNARYPAYASSVTELKLTLPAEVWDTLDDSTQKYFTKCNDSNITASTPYTGC